ncbi:MAG: ribonuclease III domain-containing protein [Clostridia bacterium]|nr:ribonuclease III domain-containing protein [Clostridia bacterium]
MITNFDFNKCNPDDLSVSSLAFVGDAVFDLMIRSHYVSLSNSQAKDLHQKTVKCVCCEAQANFMKIILPHLTEKELSIYKRGRNYHTAHIPKKSTVADYHQATALEALLGYIYLKEDHERLFEIFSLIKEQLL